MASPPRFMSSKMNHPRNSSITKNTKGGGSSSSWRSNTINNHLSRLVLVFIGILILFEVGRNIQTHSDISNAFDGVPDYSKIDLPELAAGWNDEDRLLGKNNQNEKKNIVIAYAISITKYKPDSQIMDRAAVLHQSIKLAAQKSQQYGYHVYAFVHPDAIACIPTLKVLGYRVQIHDTPFNKSDIRNEDLIIAQDNGCCGEKEYLKLYSYTLFGYPVVVHLDLDAFVLKSMDEVFHLMTTPEPSQKEMQQFAQESSQWVHKNITSAIVPLTELPNKQIDFMFTRDYNMVNPPRKEVYQIGVQGGFLLVRPNQRDFDRMIEIILSGGDGYSIGDGWGGPKLGYGGYYGAGTIQGLASFYYGHYENHTRSIELNRCRYNTMVDNPYHHHDALNRTLCRTRQPDGTCQDCRKTPLNEIYTAHFTVCGKPEWCRLLDPEDRENGQLCMELFREWHKIRLSLEIDWMTRFPEYYTPELTHVNASESREKHLLSYYQGHCRGPSSYIPLKFPNSGNAILIE